MNINELQAQGAVQNRAPVDLPPAPEILPATLTDIGRPLGLRLQMAFEWAASRGGPFALTGLPLLIFPHIGCMGLFGTAMVVGAGASASAAHMASGFMMLSLNLAAIPAAIYGIRLSGKDCCETGEKFGIQLKKAAAMGFVFSALVMDFNTLAGKGLNAPEMQPEVLEQVREKGVDPLAYILGICFSPAQPVARPS